MNFTFKKYKRVGKWRSFERNNTDIKLKKQQVGRIFEMENGEYKVSFSIKKEITKKDPAPFKWIRLKKTCNTEKDAREFIKKFSPAIQKKYDLYLFEKECELLEDKLFEI